MKYTEFKKRIEERLGFKAEYSNDSIVVIHFGHVVAYVTKRRQYDFTVSSNIITPDEARFLAHQCHELACTALEDRETKTKYKLKLKSMVNDSNYINKLDFYNGLFGFCIHGPINTNRYQTAFSKDEIDNFPEEIKNLAELCDWEVVE